MNPWNLLWAYFVLPNPAKPSKQENKHWRREPASCQQIKIIGLIMWVNGRSCICYHLRNSLSEHLLTENLIGATLCWRLGIPQWRWHLLWCWTSMNTESSVKWSVKCPLWNKFPRWLFPDSLIAQGGELHQSNLTVTDTKNKGQV